MQGSLRIRPILASSSTSPNPGDHRARRPHHRHRPTIPALAQASVADDALLWAVLAVILIADVLDPMGSTITNIAAPSIARDMGVS